MASPKQYAYYIKGNKLAVTQKNTSFNNDPNSRNYGSDSKDVQWESPLESVTDGIELEYTYAPTYTNTSTSTKDSDYFRFLGWGSDGTNLVLFTGTTSIGLVYDLTSKFAAGDNVIIKGSGRWNGIHEVSSASAGGVLTLKTKCSLDHAKVAVNVDITTAGDVTGEDQTATALLDTFKDTWGSQETPHIFIAGAANNANNGFFKVTYSELGDLSTKITLNSRYYFHQISYDRVSGTPSCQAADDHALVLYQSFYDEIEVYKGVTVMEDESFELDLPRYLSRAVVLYLKAKVNEDLGEIDKHEYYMREFKKQVEKHNNSKGSSFRQVQGFWGLR